MSLLSRILNVFRPDRLSRDFDEELAAHIQEAIAEGRDPEEARRAFGSPLRQREASHDVRVIAWLDSLRADIVFGWRQLNKRKATSAAAILSLGLAIGACTSAFRIIDALFLRPLPIAHPERLYALLFQGIGNDGKPQTRYSFSFPMLREMRSAVAGDAEVLGISYALRMDVTFGSDDEMERASVGYVSGDVFDSFGLHPLAGRLFTHVDDINPGAHPYAVLSYDYWNVRFARDPKTVGRTLRIGNQLYSIAGIAPQGFTGTEPGTVTDIFRPAMMNPSANDPNTSWLRIFIHLKPGVEPEPATQKLSAVFRTLREEQAKGFTSMPRQALANFVSQRLLMGPAASGVSNMQADYRPALIAVGVLVALVLLIACANLANLMRAQAAARAREMALRISIGAGRSRLMQLVLVEGAMLAFYAAVVGALFAAWAAPLVVSRINTPDNPARLLLPLDWRVLVFALALTLFVTALFGLAPALHGARIQPAFALKAGEATRARRQSMQALVSLQAAFCFLVVFVAGLFVTTLRSISHEPLGFSPQRVFNLGTVARQAQPPHVWSEALEDLRRLPGVEAAAFSGWPLLSGAGWDQHVSIDQGSFSEDLTELLEISPGWLDLMQIPLVSGRDFNSADVFPKAAIVNEAFARRYLAGRKVVGSSFRIGPGNYQIEIVGLVRNAHYDALRGPMPPTAYVPYRRLNEKGALSPRSSGTIAIRVAGDASAAFISSLRREIPSARPELRVSTIVTQQALVDAQTLRERLLAMLALFFAGVALLLAGVGLYGVLDYSVFQRRREIGIRMAIGAQAADIVRRVTLEILAWVIGGALAGLALGLSSARFIESLLYDVKATDISALAAPSLALLATAILAALSPVVRAVRIDPVHVLRSE